MLGGVFNEKQLYADKRVQFYNLTSTTLSLCLIWCLPLISRTWHIKRWFIGSGTMGRFEVNFGLYGYTVDGCTGITANMFNDCLADQDTMDKLMQNGWRSYFDLVDRLCNVEAQALGWVVFRGCNSVTVFSYVSMFTLVAIVVSLWLMLLANGLGAVYYLGSGRKDVYRWMVALYSIAPMMQIIALIIYGAMTVRITSIMDFNLFGSQGERSFLKLAFGSPQTITLHLGYFGACYFSLTSFVPLIIILAWSVPREKNHERRFEENYEEEIALLMAAQDPSGAQGYAEGTPAYPGPGHG
jgi:hypothetical protein